MSFVRDGILGSVFSSAVGWRRSVLRLPFDVANENSGVSLLLCPCSARVMSASSLLPVDCLISLPGTFFPVSGFPTPSLPSGPT